MQRMAERPRTRDTDPGALAGRARLLDAAEILFDEQGIDAPSARSIAAAAGHKNTAAVWYHFGDRDGLIRTMSERWGQALEGRRAQLLDEVEALDAPDRRDYLRAILLPWVELLPIPEGRRRMRLIGQLAHHPTHSRLSRLDFMPNTARAVAPLMASAQHIPLTRRPHRAQMILRTAMSALAYQATLLDEDPPRLTPLSDQEFLDDLITVVLAILDAD